MRKTIFAAIVFLCFFSCSDTKNKNAAEDARLKAQEKYNLENNTGTSLPADSHAPVSTVSAACTGILLNNNLPADTLDADTLNNAGYQLYLKEQYGEALSLFQCALRQNFNHVKANYNLACMLALLHGEGRHTDTESLFTHLRRSIALSGERYTRMQQDKDFDSIRNLDEYKQTLAFYPLNRLPADYYEKNFTLTGTWIDADSLEFYTFNGNHLTYALRTLDYQQVKTVWSYDKENRILTYNDAYQQPLSSPLSEIRYYAVSLGTDDLKTWYKTGSPLFKAIRTDDIDLLKKIIKEGVDINTALAEDFSRNAGNNYMPDYMLGTPLKLAVFFKNLRIFKLLIENGAFIDTEEYRSLIDENGFTEAYEFLVKIGFYE